MQTKSKIVKIRKNSKIFKEGENNLKAFKTFYFIGIGGISMSALAIILKSRGKIVYGSDAAKSELTQKLREEGIEVKIGDAPEYVEKSDALVLTGAIGEDNKDLIYARKLNKKIFTRAEILGEITKENQLISVAGTHGKTTTTGMIASILLEAKLDPSIHIGGILNQINSNFRVGKGKLFVTEACEYKDSFLSLKNYISVILNIQEDHLDYFKNLDNIYCSFNKFAENTAKNGVIIYNFDQFDKRLKLGENKISFGIDDGADVQARNLKEYVDGKYQFDLYYKGDNICEIKLPCFGKHNILNALASCAVALFLDIPKEFIKSGIESYRGTKRRNEIIREDRSLIIHDYAHHPTEIKATLASYKEIKKNGKLIAVFQPHTYSRTRDLFEEFLKCFDECDEVWFLPIYAAREEPIEGITSIALADKLSQRGIKSRYFDDFESCKKEIINLLGQVDLFAILGAGDIEKLAYMLK